MTTRFTRFLHPTLGRFLLALYRTRVVGIEHLPAGGAVLAGNHVSYLDPVLLWSAAPRPVHFMAKSELWNNRVFGMLLSAVLAFPVRRGSADRVALAHANEVLASEELLGIFPEGTRHRSGDETLGEANEGVAFIALRAGVPIVPVGIEGTQRAMPPGALFPRFPRVTIVFGEQVDETCCVEGSRKERVQRMTELVMARISEACELAKEI